MTTAPPRPTLLGPDGQALTRTPESDPSTRGGAGRGNTETLPSSPQGVPWADLASAPPRPAAPSRSGDWEPVRTADNAVVWERPRPVQPVLAAVPDVDPLEDTRAEAEQLLEDARAEADTIAAEARGHAARTVAAANAEASRIRETARAEADRKEERSKNLDVWMGRAVIAGAVGLTASGEYSLARLAHFPASVAWLLPFVIDIYVIQAFRRHRDIVQAIFLTIAANVVYHLAAAGMFGVTTDARGEHHATWWLIALVASIASIILWRMHVITAPPKPRRGVRESTRTDDRGPSHVSAPVSGDSAGGSADESSRERADERARERTGETSHGGTGERAYGAPRESAESPAKPSHPAPRERARSGSHRRTQKRRESAPATRTPESEVDALVALMRKRGNADAVTLTDAKKAAAGRSEATAARRLAAARTEYAKLSGGTP